jgi:hypothetical protein
MTMAVNMAYVPKPESGTKVLKMTPPLNGSVVRANFRKRKAIAFLKCLWCLEGLRLGVVIGRKHLSKYNILQEKDHSPPHVQIGNYASNN